MEEEIKKETIYTQNYRMKEREKKAREHIENIDLETFKLKQIFFSTPKKLWFKKDKNNNITK